MPCLVDIINNTAVSMTCNSEPSLEEVKKIIYQHVCCPQDVKAMRVYCKLSIPAMENQKQEDGCYCGQVHFQKLNVWFKFFNLRIYSTPKCGMIPVELHHSFQLTDINGSKVHTEKIL